MELIIRPEAEEELVDSIDWYEARSAGLGADFLRCVDVCLERIKRQPESYPVVHRGARMGLVRRFPFLVIYRVGDNLISVVAMFHAKRDPSEWKARIDRM